MTDTTESARREMLPGMPAELVAAIEAGEPFWTTEELRAEFEVIGFQAPFAVVRRKRDGWTGSVKFTHSPRYYFGWEPN